MKILGRISLSLTVLVVALVVSTQSAFAQAAPSCADYAPTTSCVCDAGRVEYSGYCYPADTNSCLMVSGACHCGNAAGSDVVVANELCGGSSNGGGSPTNGSAGGVFGVVTAPKGVSGFNRMSPSGIGLIPFMSSLIRIATIVAGIIVFMNFILAGYAYITSDGSAKVNEQVKNQLTYSVIGLVIIVASYTIIAIISLLIFGKADFILNPTISGPTP